MFVICHSKSIMKFWKFFNNYINHESHMLIWYDNPHEGNNSKHKDDMLINWQNWNYNFKFLLCEMKTVIVFTNPCVHDLILLFEVINPMGPLKSIAFVQIEKKYCMHLLILKTWTVLASFDDKTSATLALFEDVLHAIAQFENKCFTCTILRQVLHLHYMDKQLSKKIVSVMGIFSSIFSDVVVLLQGALSPV